MVTILKIAVSPYLSHELSDFDQIWYTDTNFHSVHEHLKKIDFFQIQDGGGMPYWKPFFGYISAPYWPIYANFGMEMKIDMKISVTIWTKMAIFANSRWRTAAISKSFISISQSVLSDCDQMWYADANFLSEDGYLTKIDFFFKFKMVDGRHIESRFLLYLGALLAD